MTSPRPHQGQHQGGREPVPQGDRRANSLPHGAAIADMLSNDAVMRDQARRRSTG